LQSGHPIKINVQIKFDKLFSNSIKCNSAFDVLLLIVPQILLDYSQIMKQTTQTLMMRGEQKNKE
jgi:hypothetical protein